MIGFMRSELLLASFCTLVLASHAGAQSAEPWSTYRGNLQRTAHTDTLAGPTKANVLWVLKSKDNYIASPVPIGDRLIVSGLGAFNLGHLACLSTQIQVKDRLLWSKSTPFLKQPTVSSPGLFTNHLVFGDGMHQTSGAICYCLEADKGMPVWRHAIPGELVHLEGSPTISGDKAYIGAGSAGVLCLEVDKATINGKPQTLAALQKIMAEHWKDLQTKYQAEKLKDPQFAIPPSEDQLPKADPLRVWQQGKDKWHVDAPVAVVGDKVLVASAFLDQEKLGDRSLACLDAKTGALQWQAPLKLNPWGGMAVQGNLILITGSSIRLDYNLLKGAKGFIAAYNLSDGKLKWTKDIMAGVVACPAVAGNSAIVTATDGKIRAFDVDTGERQWFYDAKIPLFAPVAIAKSVVYAGDLRGVLHAIDLSTGKEKWKLDLGSHPQVQAPGMIYGGPIIHAGRLYVATCNLAGPYAGKETAVVCIGEK